MSASSSFKEDILQRVDSTDPLANASLSRENVVPNIGRPLRDSALVASSCRTSQCSASTPSATRRHRRQPNLLCWICGIRHIEISRTCAALFRAPNAVG